MQTNHILKGSLAVAATLSMLVACGPPPNTNTNPSASPTASTEPTTAPSSSAEPTTAPSSSAEPTTAPTTAPSSSAEPTTAPTAEPTATATATATSDISVVEKTTFNGKVFDDTDAPLNGVTIKAKSLNSSVPYEATTTTSGGAYAFNNAPAGVQIEITASLEGYATRRRVEVLKSNKQGDPNANRYDFGTDGSSESDFGVKYNALSDKPEVVSMTPGRNASGVNPDTSFVLKFSESMDTDTVEENFGIYAATSEELSVGTVLVGSAKNDPQSGSLVWDESAFNISWNSDDTEVTFTFKDEQQLLTDTESENIPDYLVSLRADDGQIKDESGVTRRFTEDDQVGYFKLTDGNFEGSIKFSIDGDEDEPQIDNVEALTSENGNAEGDEIEVEFSEPMVFYTEAPGEVRGNIGGGSDDENPIYPNNYFVTVVRSGVDQYDGEQNWAVDFGGTATFDTTDRTHKTVLLRTALPQAAEDDANDIYRPGDKVTVRVTSSVVDPAGNSVDSSNDEDSDTAS